VSVTPADFELYSRATGVPMPRTPQEQMQMAPMVYKFIQNKGYQQEGFFDSALGRGLRNAAIIGGAYALGNAFKGGKTDPPNPPSGGSGGVAIPVSPVTPLPPTLDPNNGGFDPSGGMGPSGVSPSGGSPQPNPEIVNVTGKEMPVVQELVTPAGNIEIHRYDPDGVLTTQPKTPSVVVGDTKGFGPAPAPRSEVEGIRDMEFSMKPPINRDPSFFNPTGSWGVGDTANLLGSTINFGVENAPRMAAQGYYDIAKGARDLQKGYDDVKTVVGGVYDAGAATRDWHDRNLVPAGKRLAGIFIAPGLPTSASQQSGGLETGNASILLDHPDVVQSGTGSDEVQSNRNHILHGAVDRNGNPLQMSRRVNAPSGLDSEGVPIGYIPQVRARDVGPDANVNDPVEYQWYGGVKPRQGSLDEATRSLRNKYADVYESQGLSDEILPDSERVGEATVTTSTTPSGGNFLSNFVEKAKALYDENTRLANELGREQDLVQDARDHYSEEGAMTVRPQDSTSVTGFTMSPEMVFETQYKKTPDKRYGTDLSVRNTYSVDPSVVSEVANPDTFKKIERASWKEQAERGEEVVDMMNKVAKTEKGAGFLANFLSKDKEKRFIDAPREETY
jgi:hypothetical protein